KKSRLLVTAALAAGGLWVSGCSPTALVSPSPSGRPSASPTPTPTPPCNPFTLEASKQVVLAFLDAYNAGSPDTTDRFIAPAGEFNGMGRQAGNTLRIPLPPTEEPCPPTSRINTPKATDSS